MRIRPIVRAPALLAFAVFAAFAAFAPACASDPSIAADAGDSPDAAELTPDARFAIAPPEREPIEVAPIPPAPAAAPALLPCPAGWIETPTPSGAATRCAPWPEGERMTCPEGQAHFPGEPGCSPVGAPCTGDWPAELPADRPVIYVRPDATGGTGTRSAPYGSIAEALAAAEPRAVLALSRGTFSEFVDLPEGTGIYGACAAQTIIATNRTSVVDGVITVAGENTELKNLTLRGARAGVMIAEAARSITLDGVVIDGAYGHGAKIDGGRLTARSLLVRGTQSVSGSYGVGLSATGGAVVELDRAVFEDLRTAGFVVAEPDSTVELSNTAVLGVSPSENAQTWGFGVLVLDRGVARVRASVIERATESGIYVQDSGARVELRDSVVRATRPTVDRRRGNGVTAALGATAFLERVALFDLFQGAIFATQTASVSAADVLIASTARPAIDGDAYGILVQQDAWFGGRRLRLEDNEEAAIGAGYRGRAELEDVTVDHAGSAGGGLVALEGAEVEAARVHIASCTDFGADVFASRAHFSDLVIHSVRASPDRGVGFWVSGGGSAVVERADLADIDTLGVHAAEPGSSLIVRDLRASGIRQLYTDRLGGALTANDGARIESEAVLIEDTAPHGVVARGAATTISLLGAKIARVTALEGQPAHGGLVAVRGAHLSGSDVVVEDSEGDGLILAFASAELSVLRLERSKKLGAGIFASTATITDAWIRDGEGQPGRGISTGFESRLFLARAVIANHVDAGLLAVGPGTRVRLEDLVIADTESRPSDGAYGCGIDVQEGATLSLERAQILRNRSLALLSTGEGTSVTAVDLEIRDVAKPVCAAAMSCPNNRTIAVGLTSSEGGQLSCERFYVGGTEVAGVMVAPGGQIKLEDGEIAHSPIGINVQEPSFNEARDVIGVRYFDVPTTRDGINLPVPTPSVPDVLPGLD